MTVIMGYTNVDPLNNMSGAASDPGWVSQGFVHDDRTYVGTTGAVVTKVWVYGNNTGKARVAIYEVVGGHLTNRISPPVVVQVGSGFGWYSQDCKIPLPNVGTRYGAAIEYYVDESWDIRYLSSLGAGTQMYSGVTTDLPVVWTDNGGTDAVIAFYAEVTEGGVSTAGGTDTWALVASTAQGSPDNAAFTTTAINTTGANLLLVNIAYDLGTGNAVLTDSKSNTWVLTTGTVVNQGTLTDALYYCANPIVGTGHTFSVTGGASQAMSIAAFSGASTTPFDIAGGNNVGGFSTTTIKPGAVSTGETNMLLVTGIETSSTTTSLTIDAGFTIAAQQLQVDGQHVGGGLAYKVVASPSSSDPTWSGGALMATSIAAFRAGGAGGGAVDDPLPPRWDYRSSITRR